MESLSRACASASMPPTHILSLSAHHRHVLASAHVPCLCVVAEAMWTSGEHFKFDNGPHGISRCETPNSLCAEAGRLSFGTLDLSGALESLDASADSLQDRLDASTLSPKDSNLSSNMGENNTSSSSATNVSTASTKVAHTGTPCRAMREIVDYPVSPAMPMSNALRLKMSHGTPTRCLEDRSMTLPSVPRGLLRTPSRNAESPLHPLRLFNPPHAMQSTHVEGAASTPFCGGASSSSSCGAAPSTSNSFAFPPSPSCSSGRMPDGSQVLRRRNPFLGVDAVSCSPYDHSRLSMHSTMRLTVHSFVQDFFDFEEIGRGSHGKVYKCHRKIDLCPYAVKEISMGTCKPGKRERLLREIYAHSSQADNVHVVRYFNAWEQDNNLYIQTELCSGNLKKMRDLHGPFDEGRLADVLAQIASGLTYMHAHNLSHMDVKPENMFWTDRGIYKLGDFGLVTLADLGNHVDDGDKVYMSRELVMHDFCDLRKSDIFALGMSMYELASQAPLPTTGDAYHAMRDGNIPPLPGSISSRLQELILSMMHPDPAQRPSAADVVRHPLLFPLMRPESAACLRAQPSPARKLTAATDQGEMIKAHLRALDAEKKVKQLEAWLKEANDQLSLYKECVEGALKGSGPSVTEAFEVSRITASKGIHHTAKGLF